MIESLLIPMKEPFVATCRDDDIRAVTQMALDMSKRYVEAIRTIFQSEDHPIPAGFSAQDRNLDAPALYTDVFVLHYIYAMCKLGLRVVPQAIGESARRDVL